MSRPAMLAALLAMSQSPYSCHKPTAQERYTDARRCVAALDSNLKIAGDAALRRAGFDAAAVRLAAQENLDAAYDAGEELEMRPAVITRDLETARAAYVDNHSWRPEAGAVRKFAALGFDVSNCLADYYGRPND